MRQATDAIRMRDSVAASRSVRSRASGSLAAPLCAARISSDGFSRAVAGNGEGALSPKRDTFASAPSVARARTRCLVADGVSPNSRRTRGKASEVGEPAADRDIGDGVVVVRACQLALCNVEPQPAQIAKRRNTDEPLNCLSRVRSGMAQADASPARVIAPPCWRAYRQERASRVAAAGADCPARSARFVRCRPLATPWNRLALSAGVCLPVS
jgi:hypothetical protein